ncbi:MAG: DUF1192 domain-containing protein [Methylobacterium sp.]|jgi:uncharacterized small protein (DUF1192 family)|nr:DUF1192 domain-containing protein [Methylobacterium sp.]MCE2931626.1 DUF1192 domain-containing protein [Hyphomicrobiales bacterium]MCA3634157.1 DUF1192 domain-containing protein [Methylobacterium sp.]MCA3638935.1 DUF1192 domain-containing protein [Methylobacterium sp.]MCA3644620.1 DUF1192 domain-containing protein [Methylobacterium sp.]
MQPRFTLPGRAMFDDLEPTRKKTAYVLGQDVSAFSLSDLDETMKQLEAEIARLGAVRKQKSASQSAADALFRKPD